MFETSTVITFGFFSLIAFIMGMIIVYIIDKHLSKVAINIPKHNIVVNIKECDIESAVSKKNENNDGKVSVYSSGEAYTKYTPAKITSKATIPVVKKTQMVVKGRGKIVEEFSNTKQPVEEPLQVANYGSRDIGDEYIYSDDPSLRLKMSHAPCSQMTYYTTNDDIAKPDDVIPMRVGEFAKKLPADYIKWLEKNACRIHELSEEHKRNFNYLRNIGVISSCLMKTVPLKPCDFVAKNKQILKPPHMPWEASNYRYMEINYRPANEIGAIPVAVGGEVAPDGSGWRHLKNGKKQKSVRTTTTVRMSTGDVNVMPKIE